jgi:hypothetical protein
VIPRWVARLLWMVRGRRLVRLHLVNPSKGLDMTIEGILVGRWGGHYILQAPRVLKSTEESYSLGEAEVPSENVVMVEVLAK